mmetsp:Transcript_3461/g.8624  ORF Transcript_3461/g.8624 Transcript_3461/m.8624 type:complete len:475 (+) Transcript_3461:43-1467(+)
MTHKQLLAFASCAATLPLSSGEALQVRPLGASSDIGTKCEQDPENDSCLVCAVYAYSKSEGWCWNPEETTVEVRRLSTLFTSGAELGVFPNQLIEKENSREFESVLNNCCPGDAEDLYGMPVEDLGGHIFRHGSSSSRVPVHGSGILWLHAGTCSRRPLPAFDILVRYPCGYLPSEEGIKLPGYAGLSIVHLGFLFVWCVLCVKRSKWLCGLHYYLTTALALAALEAVSLWIKYWAWNSLGYNRFGLHIWGAAVGICRQVFCALVVLMGSLGWGVTKPTLPRDTLGKVLGAGLALIAANAAQQSYWPPPIDTTNFDNAVTTITVIVVVLHAATSIGIFTWVLINIDHHVDTLCPTSEPEKLALFCQLRSLLYCCVLGMAASLIGQMIWLAQPPERAWKMAWIFSDLGASLFFMWLLLFVLCIFQPSPRTYRFSYHPVSELTKNFGKSALSEDDDIGDCPGIALAAGGSNSYLAS